MKKQRGLTLIGLILIGSLVAVVAMIGIRLMPAVVEYYTVVKIINAMVSSGDAKGTVTDIRKAYDRRAAIDDTPSVTGADLDISKSGGEVVIAVAYARKVPLVGIASICLDFEASTRPRAVGAD